MRRLARLMGSLSDSPLAQRQAFLSTSHPCMMG